MALIDNKDKNMREALTNALSTADRMDVMTGYFYFSGFEQMAEALKDLKIRILVGMEIDSELIPIIVQRSRETEVEFDRYQPRNPTNSSIKLRSNYIDALVGFINDSDVFDNSDTERILELFLEKIANGTLEIKKTERNNHAKVYIMHNQQSLSHDGDSPGTVVMGSSNFTYSGLLGQGELNDSFRDKEKFLDYCKNFDDLWESAVSIAEKLNWVEFVEEVKNRVWKFSLPTPYEMYIRVLDEIFNIDTNSILTPQKITHGLYTDLEYQIDAIKMGIDRLNKYDGVIIADVVGLGKSVIAAAIARNFDEYLTVIISPPHIISQWEDYKEDFHLRAAKVYSSGKIADVFKRFNETTKPILLIIDEAHRFRNEDTEDYKMLHKITRGNIDNKTVLLTATPFNNAPKDIFALIKLFQIPGFATLKSVDNLSFRFRNLIERYTKLRRGISKGEVNQIEIANETKSIAIEQRKLIENVVIRRSRLDLKVISRYSEDLEKQGISFPNVVGPELIQYDLGNLTDLYNNTLQDLVENYKAARYMPTSYGLDFEAFNVKYGDDFEQRGLRVAQINLAKHMKRLLVMRFESSKNAFRTTLERMINTNRLIEDWWTMLGIVPIYKKGELPDPENFTDEDGDFSTDFHSELEKLRVNKGLITIPKDMLKDGDKFYEDLLSDTKILSAIYDKWFGEQSLGEYDPKIQRLKKEINTLINANPKRKIVVFSSYADTINYLQDSFMENKRTCKFTAADSNALRKEIRRNFDASMRDSEVLDQYDVLFTTDALSEGINLHRAGIVINYDIPYNPTRVIQRVGRINRINKRVFDNIYVYNFFPTLIGEQETRIKQISTLKMNLINAIIGSDTKHLTQEEELKSYFKTEFNIAYASQEELSWDSKHIQNLNNAKKDVDLMKNVRKIPRRTRIKRISTEFEGTVVFGKKGNDSIFALAEENSESQVVSVEQALPLFLSNEDEKPYEVNKDFSETLSLIRETLFSKNEVPQIKGRRQKAIEKLNAIKANFPSLANYSRDLVRIIRDFDDISEGALKDLAELKVYPEDSLKDRLNYIISDGVVKNTLNKAERADIAQEVILMVQEHARS